MILTNFREKQIIQAVKLLREFTAHNRHREDEHEDGSSATVAPCSLVDTDRF